MKHINVDGDDDDCAREKLVENIVCIIVEDKTYESVNDLVEIPNEICE